MSERFWITTLGCPKNEVDSEKLAGRLRAGGYGEATDPASADLVIVNTCAFIEAAREESVETILDLDAQRRRGSRLVVTGCLAERAGDELADALPEVDLVAGFGVPVELTGTRRVVRSSTPGAAGGAASDRLAGSFDLLELPRPPGKSPWAYVKAAEGCDRRCGFCAIPSFRGPQRSRSVESVLAEVASLDVKEVVLVAQDLASFGRDMTGRTKRRSSGADADADAPGSVAPSPGKAEGIVELVEAVRREVSWVRLLYLYPSSLNDRLIEAIVATGLPYFDLSLQHASGRLLRAMRRYGSSERFLSRIDRIREAAPEAVTRSSFILGYPGETEADHDELLRFLEEAELDWAGFFTFSKEEGTLASTLEQTVPAGLALERLQECSELQERITSRRRSALAGSVCDVLVQAPGRARSFREAPEIDGVIRVPHHLPAGWLGPVAITAAAGPDLEAVEVALSGATGATRSMAAAS